MASQDKKAARAQGVGIRTPFPCTQVAERVERLGHKSSDGLIAEPSL